MIVRVQPPSHTTVNGKPFFLIGARHMPVGGSPPLLRDAGFNGMRVMAFGGESATPQPLPENLGDLYFWSYLYDRADFTRGGDHRRQLTDWITSVRQHPNLLCYENLNEPTLKYHCDHFKSQPENLAVGTRLIHELDPNHPVWLAHGCSNTVQTLRRYNDCLDIVGCNPYPVVAPNTRKHIGMVAEGRVLDCPDPTLHAVGRYTDKMMAVAQGKRNVWMLVQAMANENWFNVTHTPEYAGQAIDPSMILYPTLAQMRFMAFDAIVSGAGGLALAMWLTPAKGPAWDNIVALVRELRGMHDVLAQPNLPLHVAVEYEELGYSIWDGVRVCVKEHQGALHLIAINTAADPARVTMQSKTHGHFPAIRIEDEFEPFGVRIHTITMEGAGRDSTRVRGVRQTT